MKERMFLIVSEGNHMTYGKETDLGYYELQPTGEVNIVTNQDIMDFAPLLEGDFRMCLESVVDTEYNYLIIELLDNNESEIIKSWNEQDSSAYYCEEFSHLKN